MIVETMQIICTALYEQGKLVRYSACSVKSKKEKFVYYFTDAYSTQAYAPTHQHHPISKWAVSLGNKISILKEYCSALCFEYHHRFGKFHATMRKLPAIPGSCDLSKLESFGDMPNCARSKKHNLDFSNYPNIVEAYRKYMIARWKTDKIAPKWTNRKPPYWYREV